MDNRCKQFLPHPEFLEILFAHKSKVNKVFRTILGIHEIDYFGMYRITQQGKLIAFSSTPALDYNLFSKPLWHFDRTFHPQWFLNENQEFWQTLYVPARYDELYYQKQIKPHFPLGLSISTTYQQQPVIFSVASHKNCADTESLFNTQLDDFIKMGHYCSNELNELFLEYNHSSIVVSEEGSVA